MVMRTVYCVQPYRGSPGRFEPGVLHQFGTSAEALTVAAKMQASARGLLVFEVRGEPDFDFWEEPEVLAVYGDVPA